MACLLRTAWLTGMSVLGLASDISIPKQDCTVIQTSYWNEDCDGKVQGVYGKMAYKRTFIDQWQDGTYHCARFPYNRTSGNVKGPLFKNKLSVYYWGTSMVCKAKYTCGQEFVVNQCYKSDDLITRGAKIAECIGLLDTTESRLYKSFKFVLDKPDLCPEASYCYNEEGKGIPCRGGYTGAEVSQAPKPYDPNIKTVRGGRTSGAQSVSAAAILSLIGHLLMSRI